MTLDQLENILIQRPNSPLFARLAHEYLIADRMEEAKYLLLRCIDTYPRYSTAYFALAECYLQEQKLTAAFDAINKAIQLNPAVHTLQEVRREIESLSEPTASTTDEISENLIIPELSETLLKEAETIDNKTDTIEQEISAELQTYIFDQEKPFDPVEFPGITESPTVPTSDYVENRSFIEDEVEMNETTPENVNGVLFDKPDESYERLDISVVPEKKDASEEQFNIPVSRETENTDSTPGHDESVDTISEIPLPTTETVSIERTDAEQDEESIEVNENQTDEDSRIVSKTLAEIFVSQNEYDEAITIYKLLKIKRPELSEYIDNRIQELERLLPGDSHTCTQ